MVPALKDGKVVGSCTQGIGIPANLQATRLGFEDSVFEFDPDELDDPSSHRDYVMLPLE